MRETKMASNNKENGVSIGTLRRRRRGVGFEKKKKIKNTSFHAF